MRPPPAVDARLVPAALGAWGAAFVVVLLPAAVALAAAVVVLVACAWPAARVLRERRLLQAERGSRGRRPTGIATAPARCRDPTRSRHRAGVSAPGAAVVLLTGAVLAAVLGTGAGHVAARSSGVLAVLTDRSATVTLTGRVLSDPVVVAGAPGWDGGARFRLQVRATHVSGRGMEGAVRAPVLVLGAAAWSEVAVGEEVRASGRLVRTEPGDDVAALMIATEPEATGPAPGPHRVAAAMRAGLVAAVADEPAQARGLVPGIAVGDDRDVPPELLAAMRAVSLTHLTAVSGAHVAIVLGTVLAVLGWLPRWTRALVAGLALGGFVVLVRPEPSVLRAATMGLVALVALLLGRPARALPALCAAVVVLLLLDPWIARSYGFVLSVLATAGIVLLARPWARALATRMPPWVAHTVAVPAAAQAACAPVVVLLDPAVATLAVPANALAAPAVPPATVLGVLAALSAPWWPSVAAALADAAGWCTAWIAGVAHAGASVPGARLPWIAGPAGMLALALATLAVAVLAPRVRWRPWALLMVAVVVVLVLLPGPRALVGVGVPRDWVAAQCDVGQGSAFVVRSGPAAAVMVDVGPPDGGAGPCLDRLGIRRLDLLVLTHLHEDHVGGLPEVLRGRAVSRVLLGPYGEPAHAEAAVLDQLARLEVPVDRPVAAGEAARGTAGEDAVSWEVLWPTARSVGRAPPGDEDAVNDLSLVVRLDGRDVSVVALGDVETAGQAGLLRELNRTGEAAADPVDVVVVAHHGSARQDPALASSLGARLALVSVGAGNDYGHPAASAVAMYAAGGALVLRTDECGTVTVAGGPDGLRAHSRCGR